ncbi:MAG: hypothetical protein AAFU78_13970, partial [Cyanobacteria bacterium J06633_2]
YSQTRFIITSRPLSYQNAGLEEIDAYLRVAPFGPKEIKTFLYNWYLQEAIAQNGISGQKKVDKRTRKAVESKTQNLIERIETGGSSPLSELAFNPLLLTMIAMVHEYRDDLPLGRVQLYAEIYKVLLTKRYQDRGIYDADIIWKTKQVLQLFALEMMHQGNSSFNLATANPEIHQQLEQILNESSSLEELLKQTDSASGLLVDTGNETYVFTHQSFQNYLAAVQIEETANTQLLLDNLEDEWWSETIHLHASQFDNATSIVQEAIQRKTLVALTLANGLVQDGITIDEAVQQQLEDTLTEGLRDSDPEIFKLAAEVTLANRIRRLQVINPVTSIDSGYITQSEYQLFLDDQQRVGLFHYPDHWEKKRFDIDDVQRPIAGVRAEDARAFCEWLNKQRPSADPGITYRYRIPVLAEAMTHSIPSQSSAELTVVPWCFDNSRNILSTEGCSQWDKWQQQLTTVLPQALEDSCKTARQLTNNQALVLLTQLPDHPQFPLLDPTLDLRQAIALANDPRLNRAFKLASSRALSRQPTQPRLKKLTQTVEVLRRKLPPSARLLNRQQLGPSGMMQYRAYLLAVITLWNELAIAYNSIVEHRQSIRWMPRLVANMSSITQQQNYQECSLQRDRTLTIYAFFVLLDERKTGRIPAWEGIRIVQEKIQH